ncbi:hypothetical protein ACFV1L_22240 [Kitasatospora sp. NPDC059646]|uniref:hypothetical protein n=1 Tax=Kitasatospora sp. NPDC059646 TaxID=3346893 RepID=UPI0036CFA012
MILLWRLYDRRPVLWRNIVHPLFFLFCVLSILLWCATVAHAEDISPVGIGDLMPSPSTNVPKGQGTLYETYSSPTTWVLDSDYGVSDVFDPMLEGIADICMALIAVIGAAVVVCVQWLFQLVSLPALENAITKSIAGAATGLTETLLPSALAVGGLIAFVQHKRGSGMSQLTWVGLSAVVSVSLLTSPGTWVNGVDTARTVGANITLNATAAGLGDGTTNFPFKLGHDPVMTGNARDDMLRKASDSVWRSYVAAPWCVAEFGSFEVCRKYGTQVLDKGIDKKKRKEWLQDHVTKDAVGEDSVTWRQGHSPVGRIMVTVPSLIAVVMFAALVLLLCFAGLASLLGALMLLLTGVIFACLWVIPGRPRQWGTAWFDKLLGYTLESFIATMTLGAVLSLQSATTQMFGTYGWLPSMGLSIAAAIVGVKFRGVLAQIFGVSGGSSSMLGGLIASQLLGKAAGKMFGGGKRGGAYKPHDFKPVEGPGDKAGSAGGNGPGRGPGGGPSLPKQRPPAPPPLPAAPTPPDSPLAPAEARVPAGAARAANRRTVLSSSHKPGPRPARRPGTPTSRPGRTPVPTPGSPRRTGAPSASPVRTADTRPPVPGRAPDTAPARTPRTTAPAAAPPTAPPSPTLRPEVAGAPTFAFRTAPPPPAPGVRNLRRGTVISTSNRPPVRVTSGGSRPARSTPAAPTPRPTARTPRPTRKG